MRLTAFMLELKGGWGMARKKKGSEEEPEEEPEDWTCWTEVKPFEQPGKWRR